MKEKLSRYGILIGSICCFIGLLGTSLTLPYLQSQRDKLGCDALCYGTMQSARSGLNMIGTFLVGRMTDGLGRNAGLWVGSVSSIFSYAINLDGGSLMTLWISLIPSSLLNQNYTVMKALFADYATDANYSESDRTASIGRLGMAAGLAFMFGPVIATTLFSSYYAANVAAIILTISSAALLFFLPETVPRSSIDKSSLEKKWPQSTPTSWMSSISSIMSESRRKFIDFCVLPALQLPGTKLLLIIRCLMSLAYHVFMVVWTVSLRSRFAFGPKQHAYYMAWIGLWYALSQGFLAKFFIQKFARRPSSSTTGVANKGTEDPTSVLQCCVLCLSLGRVVAISSTSIYLVYAVMAVVIVALGVMNTIISSSISHLARKDELGGLYGVFEAVESLAGIFGPTCGGLLERLHPHLPVASVVAIYLSILVMVTLYFRRNISSVHREHEEIKSKQQ